MPFSIIIPTLNEAQYIGKLLTSLKAQTVKDLQVIVVDGGSTDGTPNIARSMGAEVFTLNGSLEFAARNYGAEHSDDSTLIFTCADAIFPPGSLEKIESYLRKDQYLMAITGPDIPYDGSLGLKILYCTYNFFRLISARLPFPLKSFSTSTNFLAMRREAFTQIGGFPPNDVNADGLMGRSLARRYHTLFDNHVRVYISARRAERCGLVRFTYHYFYVLENFLPTISRQAWFKRLKSGSLRNHRELHTKLPTSN